MKAKFKSGLEKEINRHIRKASPIAILSAFICLILGAILGAGTYFGITRNDTFEIVGDKKIVINVGDKYDDKGAKVVAFGKDISKEVEVIGEVDTSKVGVYVIKYKSKSVKFKDIVKVRYVTVLEVE